MGLLAFGILAATPCFPTLEISVGFEEGLPKVEPRVEPREAPNLGVEGDFTGFGIG